MTATPRTPANPSAPSGPTGNADNLQRLRDGSGLLMSAALRRLDAAAEIRMYRSFDPAAPGGEPGGDEHLLDVDDPWYGDQDGFETTLAEVEAAADGVVAHVRARLEARV